MTKAARTQARPADADLVALLASVGAHVTNFVGSRCPKCQQRERCQIVHADDAAFMFTCTRCAWKGGARLLRRHRPRRTSKPGGRS
jgi:hypothetical protein